MLINIETLCVSAHSPPGISAVRGWTVKERLLLWRWSVKWLNSWGDVQVEKWKAGIRMSWWNHHGGNEAATDLQEQRLQLEDQINLLEATLRGRERVIMFNEDVLAFNRKQCILLEQQLRIASVGCIEKWRGELWATKLVHLKTSSDGLACAHSEMISRVMDLESCLAKEKETNKHLNEQKALVHMPASERSRCLASQLFLLQRKILRC